MKGELCLEEKYSTARERSLSNSSSSSQIVRPLNSHWRERLEDRGEDDGGGCVTTSPVAVEGRPMEDKGSDVVVVVSILKSSCSS
mmetsp:Transcript_10476/g.17315  ORF Transcript_10476/g.17315 Transcript_10476/m.17315 type:complete len:85 (+) Transcript_10476:564-818(+)